MYTYTHIYIYIYIYIYAKLFYKRNPYEYAGRAMVERGCRRRFHPEERSLGTACDPRSFIFSKLSLIRGRIYNEYTHVCRYIVTLRIPYGKPGGPIYVGWFKSLSFVYFWIASLRRSTSHLRLRYLERRHVRHRGLQGDLRYVYLSNFCLHRCDALRVDIYGSCTYLRRCIFIALASGWRPQRRLPRKRSRSGRARNSCMP